MDMKGHKKLFIHESNGLTYRKVVPFDEMLNRSELSTLHTFVKNIELETPHEKKTVEKLQKLIDKLEVR